jgi:hypothetical protein
MKHLLRFIVRGDGHFYSAVGSHGTFTPTIARARFFSHPETAAEALTAIRKRHPKVELTLVELEIDLADFWHLREEPS